MRTKFLGIIFAIIVALACQVIGKSIWIDNINIIPENPNNIEFITIDVWGHASSGGSQVVTSQFSQYQNDLTLDLSFDLGIIPVFSNWSYAEQIGTLEAGTYSLTVLAFGPNKIPWNGALQDTYTTEFTVTPEPATFVFLVIGLPVFRAFSGRRA